MHLTAGTAYTIARFRSRIPGWTRYGVSLDRRSSSVDCFHANDEIAVMAGEQFISPGPAVYMFCGNSSSGFDVMSGLCISHSPSNFSGLSGVGTSLKVRPVPSQIPVGNQVLRHAARHFVAAR